MLDAARGIDKRCAEGWVFDATRLAAEEAGTLEREFLVAARREIRETRPSITTDEGQEQTEVGINAGDGYLPRLPPCSSTGANHKRHQNLNSHDLSSSTTFTQVQHAQ